MANYNKDFYKWYYFVENNIIYDISSVQDKDECGLAPWSDGTKEQKLKPEGQLAAIFPNIKIEYKEYDGQTLLTEVKTKYLWLQNYIDDGDKYNGSKFEPTVGLHGDESETFVDRYINELKNATKTLIRNGYSVNDIRKSNPKFVIETEYDDDTLIGKKIRVVSTSLTPAQRFLSDEEISEIFIETAKEEATKTANAILKQCKYKVDTLDLTASPIPEQ